MLLTSKKQDAILHKKGALFYMDNQFHSCNFIVERMLTTRSTIGGLQNGFPSPRLAYIVEGECVCLSPDGELHLKKGDVWSLPAKKSYKSIWTATPYIEFYYIQYEVDFKTLNVNHFKKIENLDVYSDFKAIYESNNDFERLSYFYKIMSATYSLIADDNSVNVETIRPALEFLHLNYDKSFKVESLSSLCMMSQSKFFNEFKKITGLSPIEYKNNLKITKAVEMILSGFTLEETCEKLDYSSPSFLRRQMKKFLGKTPREIKAQEKML